MEPQIQIAEFEISPHTGETFSRKWGEGPEWGQADESNMSVFPAARRRAGGPTATARYHVHQPDPFRLDPERAGSSSERLAT